LQPIQQNITVLTTSKGLEAVVAARLSYLTEKSNLLSANHFGGRLRRSAEYTLNVLVERIYQARRNYKLLTLIMFDVKGAFNGFYSEVLVRRLKDRVDNERALGVHEMFTKIFRILRFVIISKTMNIFVQNIQHHSAHELYSLLIIGYVYHTVAALREGV
jgi:hypothetical protein